MSDQKRALRDEAKARRKLAHDKHGAAANAALRAHGLAFLNLPGRAIVSGFFAIRDEINPLPLLLSLHSG